MFNVTRELERPPVGAPPLDDSLFRLSEAELEFLRSTISGNDEELRVRILEVQENDEYPYPCIRAFHFVWLMMIQNPAYPGILASVVETKHVDRPAIFLDLGCCMGTDVRKLVRDGYPASSVIGCDVRQSYISLGYQLYGDSPSSLGIRFIISDIFSLTPSADHPVSNVETPIAEVTSLEQLLGRVTHLYTGALFHLFDEATQTAIARRLAVLLTRQEGAVIFGRHRGQAQAGMLDDHLGRSIYGHSPSSWKCMWELVFREMEGDNFVNERFKVDVTLITEELHGIPIPIHQLVWSVHV